MIECIEQPKQLAHGKKGSRALCFTLVRRAVKLATHVPSANMQHDDGPPHKSNLSRLYIPPATPRDTQSKPITQKRTRQWRAETLAGATVVQLSPSLSPELLLPAGWMAVAADPMKTASIPATMRAVQYDAWGGGATGLKVRKRTEVPACTLFSFFLPHKSRKGRPFTLSFSLYSTRLLLHHASLQI
jgi:hypothetical protein